MKKLAIALVICLTPSLWASNKAAEHFMQDIGDEVVAILNDNSLTHDQRKEKFRSMLENNFAIKAIGKFVLGKYWRIASEPEKDEFMDLFRNSIVNTYTSRFETYTTEEFKITSSREEDDGGVIVTSQLVRPSGHEVRIDWKLYDKEGRYRIYDVLLDGISMSITQRSEYAAVLQKQGGRMAGLNKAIRQKQISHPA